MTRMNTFKTTSRAALAAIVIAGSAIAAAPAAQAASPAIGFSFNSGNGFNLSVGTENRGRGIFDNRGQRRYERVCMNNHELRRSLRQGGFENIRFAGEHRGSVRVVAERGRWEYTLRVDRCDGRVAVIDRDRLHRGGNWNHRNDSGVQFRFNFR